MEEGMKYLVMAEKALFSPSSAQLENCLETIPLSGEEFRDLRLGEVKIRTYMINIDK